METAHYISTENSASPIHSTNFANPLHASGGIRPLRHAHFHSASLHVSDGIRLLRHAHFHSASLHVSDGIRRMRIKNLYYACEQVHSKTDFLFAHGSLLNHVFHKGCIAACRVVYEDVGDCPHYFIVLDNRRTAHSLHNATGPL